ncbi:hypothetical protein ACIA49_34475 [Kribbella sp. NPDC051587]|uniref:hypothetical protein n=1 Tax=Kribbella sp. NPDC051587 TaxID=3364119 RepID=UPI0037A6683F
MFTEINGHRVAEVFRVTHAGPRPSALTCLRCAAHFADLDEVWRTTCSLAGRTRGHELVADPDDGLLYCTRCPLVAYGKDDATSEPECPMPLQSRPAHHRSTT